MLERLLQVWSASPWYIKVILVFVAIFSAFAPTDFVHKVLDSLEQKRTALKVAQLDQVVQDAAKNASEVQGQITQLEAEKDKISKEDTNDATDFLNNYKHDDK